MANAKRDQNFVPTLIAALETDGITPILVKASPTNHGVEVDDDTTGIDHGRSVAVKDANGISVLMAVASDDGVTPIEVYADSSGNLLIDSS